MAVDRICFRSMETTDDSNLEESYTISSTDREDARRRFAADREAEGYTVTLSKTSEEVYLVKGGIETDYYGFDEK